MAAKKRTRDENRTRERGFLVRVTDEERDVIDAAARSELLTRETWARRVLVAAARRIVSRRESNSPRRE
jgi:hypothetical protein